MTAERLKEIKEDMENERQIAEVIMTGDADGYDGADGARIVLKLVGMMDELTKEQDEQTECHWTFDADDDGWDGTCGIKWYIPHESTPEENDMNYCPKCGRKLVVEPTEDEKSYMVADNETGGYAPRGE